MNQTEQFAALSNEEKLRLVRDDLMRRGFSGARVVKEVLRLLFDDMIPGVDYEDDDVVATGGYGTPITLGNLRGA